MTNSIENKAYFRMKSSSSVHTKSAHYKFLNLKTYEIQQEHQQKNANKKEEIPMVAKYRNIFIGIGIAIAVFLGMKYLLPFIGPFLIAYIIVRILNPIVKKLQKRIKLKKELLATILLSIFSIIFIIAIYFLCVQLLEQIKSFVANMDGYEKSLKLILGDCCQMLENTLGIHAEDIENFVYQNISLMVDRIQIYVVPDMFNNSIKYLLGLIKAAGLFFALFVSVILFLKDYDEIQEKLKKFDLYRHTATVLNRLWGMGGAYLKAQLLIMSIITVMCVAGLWVSGYPYALLLGLLIGLTDALPFIGTGTILIPWALICLIQGDFIHAAAYATLFFLTNTTREFLEPKMIGKKLGVYPIVIAVTVYAGICIYGVAGVILGPLTMLAIVEIYKETMRSSSKE